MALNIGFDRRVKLEWLDAAAWKAATEADITEVRKCLDDFLQSECRGKEARKKTITVLTRIWVRVPQKHRSLQERALGILTEDGSDTRLWLHWGMTLVAYPFFRDVADIIGRLLALQNEVSLEQVYRRLAECWGERSTVRRASQRVVRSMVDWGVLQDTAVKGVYIPAAPKGPASASVQLWFLEALLCSESTQVAILQQLPNLPSAFPFHLDISMANIRQSKRFEIQPQGLDLDMVTIVHR